MRDDVLDVRGLKCPLPALMTRKALRARARGMRLTVLADDPLAGVDIPHMCFEEGHAIETVPVAGHHRFVITVAGVGARDPHPPPQAPDSPPPDGH